MLSTAAATSPHKPKAHAVYLAFLLVLIVLVIVLGILLDLTRSNASDGMRTFRSAKAFRRAKFYDISKASRAILQAYPSNEGAQYLKFLELSKKKNMTFFQSEWDYPGSSPPDPPKWALDTHEFSHQVWLSEDAPNVVLGISEFVRGDLNTVGGSTFYGKVVFESKNDKGLTVVGCSFNLYLGAPL